MIRIASNRTEGIDWVHEQLDYIPRPLAEQTYHALIERGILVEAENDITLTRKMGQGEIRQVGMSAENERESKERGSRRQLQRRHNLRFKRHALKQLNAIDCLNEDGEEAR